MPNDSKKKFGFPKIGGGIHVQQLLPDLVDHRTLQIRTHPSAEQAFAEPGMRIVRA